MSTLHMTFHQIRQLIAQGKLRPGDKLPAEVKLSSQLGVSRGSVREALKMLTVLGVVESQQGSGTRISSLHPQEIFAGLAMTMEVLPLDSFLQIYEIRRALESHAATLAAARATDEQIDDLERLAQAARDCPDPQESTQYDHAFHQLLAEMSGDDAITQLLAVFRLRAVHYRLFATSDGPAAKAASDDGHSRIVAALRTRDPAAAGAAAAMHVTDTRDWFQQVRPEASTGVLD